MASREQRNAEDWVRLLCCCGCNPDACVKCCGECCACVSRSGGVGGLIGASADASAGDVSGVQMPMLALKGAGGGPARMERV